MNGQKKSLKERMGSCLKKYCNLIRGECLTRAKNNPSIVISLIAGILGGGFSILALFPNVGWHGGFGIASAVSIFIALAANTRALDTTNRKFDEYDRKLNQLRVEVDLQKNLSLPLIVASNLDDTESDKKKIKKQTVKGAHHVFYLMEKIANNDGLKEDE